ncbi:MAG: DUF1232 domain-containing protein [Bacteroidetes bacterium]|jgi:uncharacterized membrane protein YkvA (DUF1232 family)|nr:DUF1232 domain-containing protein [Candidatus Scalindua sp.]MBT7092951.1 DUF1232 domain-containing protein [Bacteroidota bacterium]MBT7828033.1 DUF1232 domain-containing protein [Bacteroidota bacterium]
MTKGNGTSDYEKSYTENSFWKKVKKFARTAGKELINIALQLYYCLEDSDTPTKARGVIIGALGYFIMPLDVIPDLMPVVGFSDDLGVLVAAVGVVATHIKREHKEMAKEKLSEWFGEE